jgi:hypothetical protein
MKLSAEIIYQAFLMRFEADPKKGIQSNIPEWIDASMRKSQKIAQEVIAAFEGIVTVKLAARKVYEDRNPILKTTIEDSLDKVIRLLDAYTGLMESSAEDGSGNMLTRNVYAELEDLYKTPNFEIPGEIALQIRNYKLAEETAYQIACQGFDRSGKVFTPADVAQYMAKLAGIHDVPVDVYCGNGLGLLYGSRCLNAQEVRLVGDEKRNKAEGHQYPKYLAIAYKQSEVAINRNALLERMLTEFEWLVGMKEVEGPSESLMINAALNDLPFFQHDSQVNDVENLDFLLQAGYKKVVVLVPNAYLTGGRGEATSLRVFKHCLSRGLTTVIQLPMGVIGATHEAFSILVFEPNQHVELIDFREINPGSETGPNKVYRIAERGFGMPWRKVKLNINAFVEDGGTPQQLRNQKKISDLLENGLPVQNRNKRKTNLVSFEATRFFDNSLSKDLLSKFEFLRLDEIVIIWRVQHMQPAIAEEGIEYIEIGGSDIDSFGSFNIERATKKYIRPSSQERLNQATLKKGDLFLCIRGSVGKVALMDQNSDVAVAPNQSFVKLSFKQRPKEGDLNPEILFWWLNSDVCKKALESRALSQGVPRLSIMDVAELKIPVGSKQMLMLEYQKYITWKSDAMKSLEYQNRAHALRSMAFN